MSKIGLIIQREYSSRVKKKAFILLTILVPILAAGLGFFAVWLGMKDQKHFKVLVADPRNLCDEKIWIGPGESPPATFFFYNDLLLVDEFKEGKEFEEYDIFIALDPDVITNKTINAVYREEPSVSTQLYISGKLESRLEEYFALDEGLSLEKYRKVKQPFKFTLRNIEDDAESEIRTAQQGVGFIFSILIFVFVLVYAGMVMRGVLEEKTSRVVEIVISSVKPFQLMMGKIIAIGLVGLTQFVIWIILISGLMFFFRETIFLDMANPENLVAQGGVGPEIGNVQLAAGNNNMMLELIFNLINWPVLITLFIIYFIGGFLLYGSIFAMVGSAADSETDTQQLMIPVMIPLMFCYFVSFSIIGNVDGPAAIWGSQIPLSSPIIMLQRVAAGSVHIWEVLISIILLVGAFVLSTWLASKIYRTGILMYGKKTSWKEIIKWIKHN